MAVATRQNSGSLFQQMKTSVRELPQVPEATVEVRLEVPLKDPQKALQGSETRELLEITKENNAISFPMRSH
jgi:hypothetical protein